MMSQSLYKYKVGFIRKKDKVAARGVQRSPQTGTSLLKGRLELLWTSQL
jgi:hypothetical protein